MYTVTSTLHCLQTYRLPWSYFLTDVLRFRHAGKQITLQSIHLAQDMQLLYFCPYIINYCEISRSLHNVTEFSKYFSKGLVGFLDFEEFHLLFAYYQKPDCLVNSQIRLCIFKNCSLWLSVQFSSVLCHYDMFFTIVIGQFCLVVWNKQGAGAIFSLSVWSCWHPTVGLDLFSRFVARFYQSSDWTCDVYTGPEDALKATVLCTLCTSFWIHRWLFLIPARDRFIIETKLTV